MFIRLTRLDNSPIWINAGFIVTVEPRRGGGSVVVPIGDGLDYDVKESPESVLAAAGAAPAVEVVPVPAPRGLTAMPEDVSPVSDTETTVADGPAAKPAKKPSRSRSRKTAKPAPADDAAESAGDAGEQKPAENAEPAENAAADETADAKPAKKARASKKAKKPVSSLTEEQIARLVRMAPRSIRKLHNTLVAQFRVEDAEDEIAALEANGVMSLDRDHIIWATAEPGAAEATQTA